jgi:hypothetical protein
MKRFPVVLLLPFLCAAADAPDLQDLIRAARGLPAEFSSSALLRIAGSGKVDATTRIELVQQAFDQAAGAQTAYKRHGTPSRLEGPVGYYNRVYNQDLDALSLHMQAVEAMLPLDAAKAREMFLRIPPLAVPRVTCDDFLVYDVQPFYDLLGRVAHGSPAGFRLLQRHTSSISSPVQIAPAARVIAQSGVSDDEFQKLVTGFAAALSKISGDDRSFTYAQSVGPEILALATECNRRNYSPVRLIENYRLYLVINLSASRCADDDIMVGGAASFGLIPAKTADDQGGGYVAYFNDRLRMPPLHAIQEQETTPSRLEGVADGLRSCQDEECLKYSGAFRDLVFNERGAVYLPADRKTPEWQKRLRDLLAGLDGWKPSAAASAAEQYREKSNIYVQLLSVAPDNASRELILRGLLAHIKGNPLQQTNRPEWFLPLNGVIGFGALSEELRKSDDPVIALYARLEAFAPRPPDRILALL